MKSRISGQDVVNWSSPQLVVTEQNTIVLVISEQSYDKFCGVIVSRPDGGFIGDYTAGLEKSLFKKFNGEVILSND